MAQMSTDIRFLSAESALSAVKNIPAQQLKSDIAPLKQNIGIPDASSAKLERISPDSMTK
jgi:hypothetical protein